MLKTNQKLSEEELISAQAAINAQAQELLTKKMAECMAEINATLERFGCELTPTVTISPAGTQLAIVIGVKKEGPK